MYFCFTRYLSSVTKFDLHDAASDGAIRVKVTAVEALIAQVNLLASAVVHQIARNWSTHDTHVTHAHLTCVDWMLDVDQSGLPGFVDPLCLVHHNVSIPSTILVVFVMVFILVHDVAKATVLDALFKHMPVNHETLVVDGNVTMTDVSDIRMH